MPILGINFTKIEAERKDIPKGNVNISSNVSIKGIEKNGFKLSGKESIKIEFSFNADYNPNIGSIIVEGNTIFVDEPKKLEGILNQWKKDKKLPKDILAHVMNNLLEKCNVEALILGREVGLPPNLNMPTVKVGKKEK